MELVELLGHVPVYSAECPVEPQAQKNTFHPYQLIWSNPLVNLLIMARKVESFLAMIRTLE